MNIFVTGGTGFIGSALVKRLVQEGHTVWVLSRHEQKSSTSVKYIKTPLLGQPLSSAVFDSVDAVINLAGENIAGKRWSEQVKKDIVVSRLNTTSTIVEKLKEVARKQKKPLSLLNASAIGFYGTSLQKTFTEDSGPGKGFLANLCQEWEAEALKAKEWGVSVALLRFGMVLGPNGGALKSMALPVQWAVGGIIGEGNQWISWIHRDDLINGIIWALDKKKEGPLNLVSPQPVTMKSFMEELGRSLNRPSWTALPAPLAKLLFGEMAQEMLLEGQKVIPQRLSEAGFTFTYSQLDRALQAIYSK
ncbi:TIGR01777 family oxidoreductase [Heliorestis acidaminivorans]|uniref:TIGR01777 family oxidoreductase n=1 Tax=Heliorestis acidaminivorans TaxID=553427 RepID=UPI0014792327|nr:TIGR01777 family oxidoreductase [Heliorestis acidaminivorans]